MFRSCRDLDAQSVASPTLCLFPTARLCACKGNASPPPSSPDSTDSLHPAVLLAPILVPSSADLQGHALSPRLHFGLLRIPLPPVRSSFLRLSASLLTPPRTETATPRASCTRSSPTSTATTTSSPSRLLPRSFLLPGEAAMGRFNWERNLGLRPGRKARVGTWTPSSRPARWASRRATLAK